MKTRSIQLFSTLLVLLALASCQGPVNPRAGQAGEANLINLGTAGMEVTGILNADLSLNPSHQAGASFNRRDFIVESLVSVPTDTGHPRLQVGLRNVSRERMLVQYRFVWLDAAGIEVGPTTGGWSTLALAPREVAHLHSVARSPDARQFRLLVQKLSQTR